MLGLVEQWPRGRLLDIGAGSGALAAGLQQLGFAVSACDLFPDQFQARGIPFTVANASESLPYPPASFDAVTCLETIEHLEDQFRFARECARVLAPGGHVYLSTAPYLSFAGAHLPRLKLQVPLHLLVGRRAAFSTFRFLARHAPWTLKEPANENSFIKAARRGEIKDDDLLEKVRVARLRGQIAAAGLRIVREELHVTSTVRRLPAGVARWLRDSPLTQDALISNMEYVLARRF